MLLLALSSPSLAATLQVGPTRTYTTIRAAVTAAAPGDTIDVDPGTYAEAIVVSKNLTIQGAGGAFTMTGDGPVIDLDGTPTFTLRDAVIAPAAESGIDVDGGTVALERVTVQGANAAGGNGAALHVSGGTVTVTDGAFTNNASADEQGGHVYAADATLIVTNSTFTGGAAEKGGAIWMLRGSLTATGATFTGNRATTGTETARGGAVRSQDAALVFTDCTFDDNAAIGGYGGHVSTYGGSLVISGGSFANGLADQSYGGAIAAYQSTVSVTGAAFTANRATVDSAGDRGHGGAIIVYGPVPGALVIDASTFTGNTAQGYGGAIRVESGPADITDSVFTTNQAPFGGAIHALSTGAMTLTGTVFTGNTAVDAGGAVRWRPNDTSATLVVTDTVFEDNSATGPGGGLYASASGNLALVDTAFLGNAGYPGGGLSMNDVASASIVRATFCQNVADATTSAYGGGIYAWQTGPTRIANSAFVDNVANAWGGAVHIQESGQSTIENSAFLSNTATTGGAVGWSQVAGSFRNNVVLANAEDGVSGGQDASATFSFDVFTDNVDAPVAGSFDPGLLGSTNLLDVDPGFVAWTDDGDCGNDVLRLRLDSPLLDMGDATVQDPDGSRSDIGPAGGPDADPDAWLDTDGDGSADLFDCMPDDASVWPGQPEVPYDGLDQDCVGGDLTDVDADGYPGGTSGSDCDDEDAERNPGADEVAYDGVDQNCNGEDLTDVDQDGYDARAAGGDDCDDKHDTINPGATDIPGDFVDQDCDGVDADGGDPIDTDEPDDEEPARKTCNCGTGGSLSSLAWGALAALVVRRRRAR